MNLIDMFKSLTEEEKKEFIDLIVEELNKQTPNKLFDEYFKITNQMFSEKY